MSTPGRMKTLAGGHLLPDDKRTLASATTLILPDDTNLFYVTGTTTIATLSHSPATRNREVTLIGASGCNCTLTNTNTPASAGQMYLKGEDRNLSEDTVLKLFIKNTGYVVLVSTTNV